MSTSIYTDGVLRQQWDDATTTYTEWDANGVQTLSRQYTADERAAALTEAQQNATISDVVARLLRLEQYVFGTTPPPTTPSTWDPSEPVPPSGFITFTDGKTYKNISGAWLVSGPDVYPIGWSVQGAQTTAWAAGVAYKTGDQVTYQSKKYQCLQAHTSQTGWEPPNAPSLWQAI